MALGAVRVHAMMDCSDGPALDALRMARASGVAMQIDLDRIPLADGVRTIALQAGFRPDEMAATGGEDYELLVALPPQALSRLNTRFSNRPSSFSPRSASNR